MSNELTRIESTRYLNLKNRIKVWVNDRFAVGLALGEIQEKKLYRQDFDTFEEFCVSEFNFQKSQAYRMIEAAQVKESVKMSPIGDKLVNEGQARALSEVAPSSRERVLTEANRVGPITAKSITKAAEKIQNAIQLDKLGHEIPESIELDWNRAAAAKQYLDALSKIKCFIDKGVEEDDVIFREVNANLVATLKNAYSEIKRILPHAVCVTCHGHHRSKCTGCRGRGFMSEFMYAVCVPEDIKKIRALSLK